MSKRDAWLVEKARIEDQSTVSVGGWVQSVDVSLRTSTYPVVASQLDSLVREEASMFLAQADSANTR